WRLPAVCARPESSESRSQSRAGLIPASSFRSSSDSDTFELQQSPLVLHAERSVRPDPVSAHDAMARHDEREPVARAESPRRALRPRPPSQRSQLAVADDLPAWNAPQSGRERQFELGRTLQVDFDVEEIVLA